ncbi:hypothetical protein NMG60_11013007 [Bertholletia excelsa]
MSVMERKKAIKLSADVAMASARQASTCWSQALIADASKNIENKFLLARVLGNDHCEIRMKKASSVSSLLRHRIVFRSKNILRRSQSVHRMKKTAPLTVKQRTQVLKRLIPGGEAMDRFSLLEETLDYIVSLRAQVDVMRLLACANERVHKQGHFNC